MTAESTLTSRAYDIPRKAIADMPIYDGSDEDCRLDERALAEDLGISRTPGDQRVHRAVPAVRHAHAHIIEALEARDADAVEARVRQHVLDLARHVRLHVSHLK
jgi:DNA-binding GntR family transcriptional regulator